MASPIYLGASDRNVSSDSLLSVQSNNPMMGGTDVKSTTEEQQQRRGETPTLELVNSPISQSSGLAQRSLLPPTGGYKTYKRRFFGLAQLVLLNIIVSWDVSSPNRSRCTVLMRTPVAFLFASLQDLVSIFPCL